MTAFVALYSFAYFRLSLWSLLSMVAGVAFGASPAAQIFSITVSFVSCRVVVDREAILLLSVTSPVAVVPLP